jgi:hypothetical protein
MAGKLLADTAPLRREWVRFDRRWVGPHDIRGQDRFEKGAATRSRIAAGRTNEGIG